MVTSIASTCSLVTVAGAGVCTEAISAAGGSLSFAGEGRGAWGIGQVTQNRERKKKEEVTGKNADG